MGISFLKQVQIRARNLGVQVRVYSYLRVLWFVGRLSGDMHPAGHGAG